MDFLAIDSRSSLPLTQYLFIFHLFSLHKTLGRYKIAEYLGISNIKTRVLLYHLVSHDMLELESKRRGHRLSEAGKAFWDKIQEFMFIPNVRIHLDHYTLAPKDAAVCLKVDALNEVSTVSLRDAAFLNGAVGCTVFLQMQENCYLLDSVYPPLPQEPFTDRKARQKLMRLTSSLNWRNILLIIGTGQTVIQAQLGAIGAAFLLFPPALINQLSFLRGKISD